MFPFSAFLLSLSQRPGYTPDASTTLLFSGPPTDKTPVTPDLVSCLHVILICSSKQSNQPISALCPSQKGALDQRVNPKNVLIFVRETLQRRIMCFCRSFKHLSEVTKRWLTTKSLREQNGRESNENHSSVYQTEKKNSVCS